MQCIVTFLSVVKCPSFMTLFRHPHIIKNYSMVASSYDSLSSLMPYRENGQNLSEHENCLSCTRLLTKG